MIPVSKIRPDCLCHVSEINSESLSLMMLNNTVWKWTDLKRKGLCLSQYQLQVLWQWGSGYCHCGCCLFRFPAWRQAYWALIRAVINAVSMKMPATPLTLMCVCSSSVLFHKVVPICLELLMLFDISLISSWFVLYLKQHTLFTHQQLTVLERSLSGFRLSPLKRRNSDRFFLDRLLFNY